MTDFQAPRGMPDWLPPRSALHQRLARTAEDLFALYGYMRIETPVFEHTELFLRGLDAASDMVTKEMYTFQDKGGRSLTLRPEGTAPVVRAVIQHNLHRSGVPVKLYYTAAMFRHDRPQKARYRQHTQVGVEAVGSEGPQIDAEVVELASSVFQRVGLADVSLLLGSIGHPACRADYMPKLVEFLNAHKDDLDDDCRRKIDTNPLRTFDCKVPEDRELLSKAPAILDHLCDECRGHFEKLQELLGGLGLSFTIEPRLVRGLDYYTRTTFEFQSSALGAQNSLGGGGRYDGLAEALGSSSLPGIGFGLGIDRIADALEAKGRAAENVLDAYIVAVGDAARERVLQMASTLRRQGISVDLDFEGKGVKAQFRSAARSGAKTAIVIGDNEIGSGTATLHDMGSGDERQVPLGDLAAHLRAV